MRSNKEHVRAQTFLARRLHTAAVTGVLDDWEPPSRRTSVGAAIGTGLAVILVLGVLAYGYFRPAGGPVLAAGTTVVVVKETGSRFLVDGRTLRPVANLASAMLLAGPDLQVQRLSERRAGELMRGGPVGIPGAPETVPAAAELTASGWAWCVPPRVGVYEAGAELRPFLRFGDPREALALGAGKGLLVADPSGAVYLVVGDQRFGIASANVRSALGYDLVDPVRVPESWLASLRPGRPLAPPELAGVGEPGPDIAGTATRIGQILTTHSRTGQRDYVLVGPDSLVPLTPLERALLLSDEDVAAVNRDSVLATLPPGESLATSGDRLPGGTGWPPEPPAPREASEEESVCVAGDDTREQWVGLLGPPDDAAGTAESPPVQVPPGSAVLAEIVDPGGSVSGGLLLIDELGRAFPVASVEALTALGYDGVDALPLPASLVGAFSIGPTLSPEAAQGTGVEVALAP